MSRRPHRSPAFLAWAKRQGGPCCLCAAPYGIELHHIGAAGMGQKGSDLLVARVCRACHARVQGKRRLAFGRLDDEGSWCDLLEDALALLAGWAAHLEGQLPGLEVEDAW